MAQPSSKSPMNLPRGPGLERVKSPQSTCSSARVHALWSNTCPVLSMASSALNEYRNSQDAQEKVTAITTRREKKTVVELRRSINRKTQRTVLALRRTRTLLALLVALQWSPVSLHNQVVLRIPLQVVRRLATAVTFLIIFAIPYTADGPQ